MSYADDTQRWISLIRSCVDVNDGEKDDNYFTRLIYFCVLHGRYRADLRGEKFELYNHPVYVLEAYCWWPFKPQLSSYISSSLRQCRSDALESIHPFRNDEEALFSALEAEYSYPFPLMSPFMLSWDRDSLMHMFSMMGLILDFDRRKPTLDVRLREASNTGRLGDVLVEVSEKRVRLQNAFAEAARQWVAISAQGEDYPALHEVLGEDG